MILIFVSFSQFGLVVSALCLLFEGRGLETHWGQFFALDCHRRPFSSLLVDVTLIFANADPDRSFSLFGSVVSALDVQLYIAHVFFKKR